MVLEPDTPVTAHQLPDRDDPFLVAVSRWLSGGWPGVLCSHLRIVTIRICTRKGFLLKLAEKLAAAERQAG